MSTDHQSATIRAAGRTPSLANIVKKYDIRGPVDEDLTDEAARALGWAFARHVAYKAHIYAGPSWAGPSAGPKGWGRVVIGHDMRASSPGLAHAFADGVADAGLDVTMAALCSTDMIYYAAGTLPTAGAMITASHNPARYNGIKLALPGAAPLSIGNGLDIIGTHAQARLDGRLELGTVRRGRVTAVDLLPSYAAFLRELVDLRGARRLRVVVDAGNGMAGHTVPAVLADSPVTVEPLYFELDGSFPNHEANPLDPANLVDLQEKVRASGADLGLAFDGDADRCFVVDERGEAVSPSAIIGLVATRELGRRPGATVLHNLIVSRAVPEIIREAGGTPVRTPVGHSLIKSIMAKTGAVFGGEHSAHYYFADFFGADTGMLAALHVLAALGEQSRPMSELVASFERYSASGEINSVVADPSASMTQVRVWARLKGAQVDELDGLTVALEDGSWFNVRCSNTEPLLRLNVEASTTDGMIALRDTVLDIVRAATRVG